MMFPALLLLDPTLEQATRRPNTPNRRRRANEKDGLLVLIVFQHELLWRCMEFMHGVVSLAFLFAK